MYNRMLQTDRNKETSCPICPLEEVWKQLQPRVITIHDQLALAGLKLLCSNLCEPCILSCKCRRGIGLCKVQYYIKEGGNGARSNGFDTGHRDSWRSSMSCEWEGIAVSNKTEGQLATTFYNPQGILYLCTKLMPLSSPNTKSLLSASTTMKTNLSNGALGGFCHSFARS